MDRTPLKDRTLRLTLFGSLAVVAGIAWALLAAVQLLWLAQGDPAASVGIEPRDAAIGAVTYALVAAAFVAVGIGSVRRRRWARPMMLALAWTWLLGGATTLVLLPGLLDAAPDLSGTGGAAFAALVRAAVLGIVTAFGIVLPAAFVWVYRDGHLQRTCEVHDPEPGWTASCPPPVLGLSVGLAACAAIALLEALRPAVPLFGTLVTGWPGALLLIASAPVCLWLARETYRRTPRGWSATTAFLVLVGASTWLTLRRSDGETLAVALGLPEGTGPAAASLAATAGWLTLAVTLGTVVYMGFIRKHFTAGRPKRGTVAGGS